MIVIKAYFFIIIISSAGMIPAILKWEKNGASLSARMRSGLSLETEKLPGISRVKLYIESVNPGTETCIYNFASYL